MERETGIGPATNSLEGCDSTTELLPQPRPLYQLQRAAGAGLDAGHSGHPARVSRAAFGNQRLTCTVQPYMPKNERAECAWRGFAIEQCQRRTSRSGRQAANAPSRARNSRYPRPGWALSWMEAAPAKGRIKGMLQPDCNRKLAADLRYEPETNSATDIDLIDYQ